MEKLEELARIIKSRITACEKTYNMSQEEYFKTRCEAFKEILKDIEEIKSRD